MRPNLVPQLVGVRATSLATQTCLPAGHAAVPVGSVAMPDQCPHGAGPPPGFQAPVLVARTEDCPIVPASSVATRPENRASTGLAAGPSDEVQLTKASPAASATIVAFQSSDVPDP